LTTSSATTWLAFANAAAVASLLPWRISARCCPWPRRDSGAHHRPLARADPPPSKVPRMTITASAASRACRAVSATTTATGPPTNRTRSRERVAAAWRSPSHRRV
jgi:hypothetical protein